MKLENAGKLYCLLKHQTNGISTIPEALKLSEEFFKVSDRTTRRWLKQALENNWIGLNPKTKLLYVRSWQYLFNRYQFPKKASYRFKESDLKDFKTYCFAALIQYLCNRNQDRKLERQGRYKTKKRSIQAISWAPVASSGVSKIIDTPLSTVHKYKQKSHQAGFIEKRVNCKETKLKVSDLILMRKIDPDLVKRMFIKNDHVLIRLADEVKVNRSNIHSPRRFYLSVKYPHISS